MNMQVNWEIKYGSLNSAPSTISKRGKGTMTVLYVVFFHCNGVVAQILNKKGRMCHKNVHILLFLSNVQKFYKITGTKSEVRGIKPLHNNAPMLTAKYTHDYLL